MNVNSVSGSAGGPLYQASEQKSGGQVVWQQQQPSAQGPAEESKESAAVQGKEAAQNTESTESNSINVYA